MLRATLKSLLAHKLRLVLSGAAVVLGVAFVAGTMVFTDTLSKTFKDLFEQVSADVTVQPASDVAGGAETAGVPSRTVPADLVSRLEQVDGVRVAEGGVSVPGVQVVGSDGKVIGTPGAPTFGVDWSDTPGISPLRLSSGRAPAAEGEIAVDEVTADKGDFALGDTVSVLTATGPRVEAELVGVVRFGTSGNLAGATLSVFDRETAQELFLDGEGYSAIALAAEEGVTETQLKQRVLEVLPAGLEAVTGAEQAAESAGDIEEGLAFINVFLLVFAGIALFVGAFIILNTFSILVAQRTRELALLRAIGASRRQVARSVLLESLAVGVVGATLGLALGLGIALLLQQVFESVGLEVPSGGLVLEPDTVAWSYVVGVVVTVVAAYVPARRAARVSPMAALRDDTVTPAQSMHRRLLGGGVLVALAALAMVGGVVGDGSQGASLVGVSALLGLVGAAVLSPVLSRPVVRVLGAPIRRVWGTVGRLSRENTLRNPRRTAATASALMIGLALVSALSVLGASTKSSLDALIDDVVGADFVVTNPAQTAFSPTVADELEGVEGVATVARERWDRVERDGEEVFVAAVEPETMADAITVTMLEGSLAGIGDGGLVLSEPTAEAEGLAVGDTVELTFRAGERELPVVGIAEENPALAGWIVSIDTLTEGGGPVADNFVYVSLADGADAAGVEERIDAALADQPNVTLSSQQEFKEQQRGMVNQLLTIMYALLVLSVLIAVLGIVNTLVLSVTERRREIGLLRAVGTARRQIRQMVRLESVVISVFGALLGLVVGLVFGVTLQQVLADDGIEILTVPVGQLAGFVVVAAVIGVLAAVWPAYKASRLDVLAAIATD